MLVHLTMRANNYSRWFWCETDEFVEKQIMSLIRHDRGSVMMRACFSSYSSWHHDLFGILVHSQ